MPLLSLPSAEAVANRKENPFAGWGGRGGANRVEPVAAPHFEVPFKLAPGGSIFTIGSCFARNVEAELIDRGFDVPVRRIFERPEFQGVELQAINNYGVPSIHNEIAWAFVYTDLGEPDVARGVIDGVTGATEAQAAAAARLRRKLA